ncbi:DNA internalization-related competence protein ComEC/Rec2 [Enterococcus saccharolyticus]|nr:DNA internalization-related competence protein ComEC/Rec2 [Enterococcus saccharolyticus]
MTSSGHVWKNQLIFPVMIVATIAHARLLHQPFFIIISLYFIGILCYKKQVVLLLLSLFCSFFVIFRVEQTNVVAAPSNQEMQFVMQVYPDTIQLNGDLIQFEGMTKKGKIKGQYKAKDETELASWQKRAQWNKTIAVKGIFRENAPSKNKHGFDQQAFLFASNQLGTFLIDDLLPQGDNHGWSYLRQKRAALIDWLELQFPQKIATYFMALLVGYRNQSFQELRDIYSSSGILHFFTISGMHVYIFYGWLHRLLRRTRLVFMEFGWIMGILIVIGIVLFGQGISVWRASLLYGLNLLLKEKKIYLSSMDRFSIVLLLLLLLNPKTLLQLSGILSVGMSWLILLRGSNVVTLWQQVCFSQKLSLLAAPVMMYFFFEIPLFAGLLTAVCGPLFQFLLPASVLICGLQWAHIPVAGLITLLTKGIVLFESLLQLTKPFVFVTGQPHLLFVIVVVIISLLLHQKKTFLLPLVLLVLVQQVGVPTAISFVDVGQGDSIVLQSRGNREVYVVDTGGRLQFKQEPWKQRHYQAGIHYSLLPFLKGEGVRQIDGLFLTHGDADHMGDAQVLIENLHVKWIYVAKGSLQHPNVQKLGKNLPARTKIREVEVNERIGDEVVLQILGPNHRGKGENDDSLVLATTIQQTKFLMTGDLGKAGEQELLTRYPQLQIDVMKLGHHGSKTSTDENFIQRIQLKQGIISAGKNNSFGHPHQEVLDVLNQASVQILRTDEMGMIRYTWSFWHQHLQVEVMKDD